MHRGSDVIAASRAEEAVLADCRRRFMNEARALVRLGGDRADPRIVRVLTLFEANNTAYSVKEFVAGEALEQRLRREPNGAPSAGLEALLRNLLPALGAVHDARLLYRDLKPANIVLRTDGLPMIIDFGSARELVHTRELTYTQIFSGAYAPIEQLIGLRQGPFSNIYALGMTAYRAIGGTPVDAMSCERLAAADGIRDRSVGL